MSSDIADIICPGGEWSFVEPKRSRHVVAWVAVLIGCMTLLGQGERARVDPRFKSPSAVLCTYWGALSSNDVETARECFADPEDAVPVPGALWFLPPSRQLSVCPLKFLPVESHRVVATYQVRFRPVGARNDVGVMGGCELVKTRVGWRILGPTDGGLPQWSPIPRSVDM